MSGFGLADLFDLELRTLEERGEGEESRQSRYRSLGRRIQDSGGVSDDPGALLRSMLRLGPSAETPGSRFESAVGRLNALVALGGVLLGSTVSMGLLHYGGEHPVNVLNALAALVGVQLVLLVLLAFALIPRSRPPSPGVVPGILRLGLRRISRGVLGDRANRLEERLDAHRGLLRWLLVRSAQVFGVAFNLAALGGCFYRILFSDVAFGWSTTLHLEPGALHGIVKALSAPWAWIFPDAVPTRELLELTQYSHLEGKYLARAAGERSLHPWVVGGWWPFLLLSVGTYGLLPRLAMFAFSSLRLRTILLETPSRNEEFRRIVDWMRLPQVRTTAPGPDAPSPPAPVGTFDGDPALPPRGSTCEVAADPALGLSRETLDRLVRDRFGWTIAAVLDAGDFASPGSSPDVPLLVVIPSWEEPTKGHQRPFHHLPPGRVVVLGLLDPSGASPADPRLANIRKRWKRDLETSRAGLRLRVEPLGPPT